MSTFVRARTHFSYSSSSRSVYAPDDCADGAADYRLDLEITFLEPMNDADVRQTSSAALPRTRDTVFLFVVDIFSPHAFD